jgi:hypothetical protein
LPGLLATRARRGPEQPVAGQHQGHNARLLVKQSARGEGERLGAGRRQRLHLDVRVLVTGNRVGPTQHRQRLEVAGKDQAIRILQGSTVQSSSDDRFHVLAVRTGQQQGGVVLQGDPGRQRRHAAHLFRQIGRVGDDQRTDRTAARHALEVERHHRWLVVQFRHAEKVQALQTNRRGANGVDVLRLPGREPGRDLGSALRVGRHQAERRAHHAGQHSRLKAQPIILCRAQHYLLGAFEERQTPLRQ